MTVPKRKPAKRAGRKASPKKAIVPKNPAKYGAGSKDYRPMVHVDSLEFDQLKAYCAETGLTQKVVVTKAIRYFFGSGWSDQVKEVLGE